MSFEKLKKGLHIYFGIVIFMVLLFSVCGMVDKNSNSSSSNDVSKAEPGLIGSWVNDNIPPLEIKNNTMEMTGINDETGELTKMEFKIVNVDSTAKNITVMFEMQDNGSKSKSKYAYYDVTPYYLSADGKELIFGFSSVVPQGLWTKK